jgi:hypothetical protein
VRDCLAANQRSAADAAIGDPRWWRLVAASLALACLAGCQGTEILSNQQAAALIQKTKVGMSRDEVVAQLGPPHRHETYEATEFLFYNASWAMKDAASQQSPVAIVDGKVAGLGRGYYASFVKTRGVWEGGDGVVRAEH